MTRHQTQFRLLVAWLQAHARKVMLDPEDDRGDGILVWVIMTTILAAAAITVVAIIVAKATSKAHDTNTQ